ncbi:MAG: hypothetical protein KA352_04160 [Flavobacteriales bacterium]|nr:hypothetical protein [Flavobacteriales bacterium]
MVFDELPFPLCQATSWPLQSCPPMRFKTLRPVFFLVTVASCLLGIAQNGYQEVLDSTVVLTSIPSTVRTSDLGQVINVLSADGMVIYRTDAAGQVLWVKRFAIPFGEWSGTSMVADASGGFIIGGYSGLASYEADTWEPDTVRYTYHFARIDAQGNVSWEESLDRRFEYGSFGPPYPSVIEIEPGPIGSWIVGLRYAGYSEGLDVLSLGANGLNWARSLGYQTIPGTMPQFPVATGGPVQIGTDPSGGTVVGVALQFPETAFELTKLDPSGTFLWSGHYDYPNGAYEMRLFDVAIDASGRPNVFANLGTFNGASAMLGVVAPNGSSIAGELIPVVNNGMDGRVQIASNGDRLLSIRTYNGSISSEPQWILRADTLGSLADMHMRSVALVGTDRIFFQWLSASVIQERFSMAGLEHRQDTIFSNDVIRPVFFDRPVNDLSACFWTDTLLGRYPVPPALLTTAPAQNMVAMPIDTLYSEPLGVFLQVTDLSVAQLDACAFSNGLSDAIGHPPGPYVENVLVSAGMPLVLREMPKGELSLYDQQGRLVKARQVLIEMGRLELSTEGLAAGLYLLGYSAHKGRGNVIRVVIQ